MSRNVFEVAKSEREKRDGARETQAVAAGGSCDKKLAAEMQKAGLGAGAWITIQEAASRLGLSESGVKHVLRTGLMNTRKVAGRRLVEVASVERELGRRNRAEKKAARDDDGRWTIDDGRTADLRSEDEHDDEYEQERRTAMVIEGIRWIDYDNDDIWAPAWRACEILCVSQGHLLDMGRDGKLRRRWADRKTCQEIENPIGPNGRRVRGKWAIAMFSLKELNRLASAKESKAWARGFSPNDPERPLRTSFIRTSLTAPPGDVLITRAEAAAMLNVTPMRISDLVKRGTLFGW
jgi:hypothetical protein